MANVPTVFARSAGRIAGLAAAYGSADRLLRSIGLDWDAVYDPLLRIPYTDMILLYERAASMTADSAFGLHVGERVDHREYGVVGWVQITSATLGEALRSLIRFLPIWTDVGAFSLEVEQSVAHFQWQYAHGSLPEARHDCEMSMAMMMTLNRLSGDGRPQEVWFQHPKPKDTSEHARIFRAPVRFGMPANALLLDRRSLDLPLRTAQTDLHREVTTVAEKLLPDASGEASMSQAVLSFVRRNLSRGRFDVESAARELGVSRRTLQRKLREECSSYRDLVQRARQDLSQYFLLDTPATATATAYALGYSDPSVFHRAFQKWHGKSPGAYRQG
jgi:AraC-like DNA-binding protein